MHVPRSSCQPIEKTFVNVRKRANLIDPVTKNYLELDVWIPSLKICFEFQDAYHYTTTWYTHKTKESIKQKDSDKKWIVRKSDIELITIPCWWDGQLSSLVATISFQRPDIVFSSFPSSFSSSSSSSSSLFYSFSPVPLNEPNDFFDIATVPSVGELMLASFPVESLSLSFSFSQFFSSFAPYSWWAGEKYDGLRSCWNSHSKILYNRAGRQLNLLPQLYSFFSDNVFLDCELWFGRRMFSQSHMLHKGIDFVSWEQFRVVAFDVPSHNLSSSPFEKRYSVLLSAIHEIHPFQIIAPRIQIERVEKIFYIQEAIQRDGGEGVILRRCSSFYVNGRSPLLLKLKSYQGDKEGIVIEVRDREVIVQLPNGVTFGVPKENIILPKIMKGDIVSFSFEGHAKRDIPVNPKIYRIRSDLSWNDVLDSNHSEKKFYGYTPTVNEVAGVTGEEKIKFLETEMRNFMEKTAKENSMNPLLPLTWYSFPYHKLSNFKQVLHHHKGYAKTIQHLFPEIIFDNHLFPRSSWNEVENRRNFFENYSKKMKFDHNDPEQWYLQPMERILSFKGASRVIEYHKHSVVQALTDLFPNIGLVTSRFYTHWSYVGNRRKFFEDYAKENGFDYLVAEFWMMQPKDKIMASEGAKHVIGYHKGRIIESLYHLFPNVFRKSTPLWSDIKLRKEFFEKYAKDKQFDSLVPSNWYSQSRDSLMSTKGIKTVLSYHKNSLPLALFELFPSIGFTKNKLQFLSVWNNTEKRKKAIEKFAADNEFDSNIPENWYSLPRSKLLQFKELNFVKIFYQGSIAKALSDVYPSFNKQKLELLGVRWDRQQRRKFLENYSRKNSFDYLSPEGWYLQSEDKFANEKGANIVIDSHGTMSQALQDLFPEINFDSFKIWAHASKNRRKYFEEFATANNFDSLLSENWYLIPLENILRTPNVIKVISYHGGCAATAIFELFPEIGLDKNKLLFSYNTVKSSGRQKQQKRVAINGHHENGKKFFERYAKENGFDPNNPDNWYIQSKRNILSHKGGFAVIANYNHNIVKALINIFPNIGIQENKFINL